jgi:hypothetical protein
MCRVGWVAVLLSLSTEAASQFKRVNFGVVKGKVGHHLSVPGPIIDRGDLPAGNTGGASSGTCDAAMDKKDVAFIGTLPPGIQLDTAKGTGAFFTGTPRQPGDWSGKLDIWIGCNGGPDITPYRRQIPIAFSIEP